MLQPVDRGLLRHDIGLCDCDGGLARRQRQPVGVALLRARPALRDETRGALVGDAAKIGVGFRLLHGGLELDQLSLRLLQLLIEIGRCDHRKDIAFLQPRSDVGVAGLDIACRAREKRRAVERRHIAGQFDGPGCAVRLGDEGPHGGGRVLARLHHGVGLGAAA